jgi:hypothetical protein
MSTTEYDVCLVISSSSLTLDELVSRIGMPAGGGSHDRGQPHLLKSRGVWKESVWQQCAGPTRTTHLEDQFLALEARVPRQAMVPPGTLPADARVYFSVGVFSDAQMPTVDLTRECLRVAQRFNATIEVRVYISERPDA